MTLSDKEVTEVVEDNATDKSPPADANVEPSHDPDKDDAHSEKAEPEAQSEPCEEDVLRSELEQVTDRLMRQAAEFQNYRRRTEQEKSQMVQFGKGMVIQQLLDVFDDFHRSIDAASQAVEDPDTQVDAAFDSLKSGVELAYQKLIDELKKMDVEPIESIGTPFDEDYHEAVMQQPVGEDEEAGIVLTEIQRGFRMGEKVLRHAKVVVSSKPSQNQAK